MKRNNIASLLWVLKLQWQTSRSSLGWGVFNSVFSGLRPIAQTYALAKLLSNVSAAALQGAEVRSVYVWLAVLLGLEIIQQLMAELDRLFRFRFQQQMELVMNERFITKMYQLSQEQFDDESFNTKLGRARDSLGQTWRIVNELAWATSTSITFVGSVVAILLASPVVGVVIVVTVLPLAVAQVHMNRQREAMYKRIEPYERVAYRSRWMLIDPAFMAEIRLMNGVNRLFGSFRNNLKKSHNISYKTESKLAKFDMLADVLQPLISFGANVYFFRMLLAGAFGLDRFIFLRGMLEQAASGVVQVTNSVQQLHEIAINLQNFSDVYNVAPSIPNGQVTVNRPVSIEFKNVSFQYPSSDEPVLHDVSFKVVPGSKLALVGENGAGKTTLIKLLLRQYLPTSGTILVNGTDIRDIEVGSYYAAISNLSQDYLIVSHLTIKDNLLMGVDGEITDKSIYAATDLVGATEFINKLPHKLGTRMDTSFDDGTNFSGGQRQRLAVARSLLRGGDIMILDEPTSAIDAKAEYTIFNNIYQAHAGKTTLIVSHRFSTVRKADKIIVMEHGKITEYGSHEELLAYGGVYKEMFALQAEGYR